MKKLLLIAPVAFALLACDKQEAKPKATAEDGATVMAAIQTDEIIALGDRGDFIVRIPISQEIVTIANKEKTAMFLSARPTEHASDESCLVNIIPYAVMQKMNAKYSSCIRLVCGKTGVNFAKLYAVEICE
ncbi:MAG: hypothetical protein FWG18_03200 [Alphaproteobacteria bacterium]|nr:hypothetical protein [Alphaproteobacteria bacterium]